MKPQIILQIILLLLVSINCFCQNRFPVRIEDKYGFIDNKGVLKIDAIFDEPFEFENNIAIYTDSNLITSLIDTSGKRLFSFKGNYPSWVTKKTSYSYNYNLYYHFSSDLLPVFDTISKLYGFVDRKGNLKISPKFTRVSNFKEGLAAVGFWSNDLDIPYIHHSESAAVFDKTVKWGFIDISGNLVIDTLFYDFNGFENGICWVKNNSSYEKYFIDKTGNRINPDTISDSLTQCWLKSLDGAFRYQKDGKCIGAIINYKAPLFTARENFDGVGCNGMYGFVNCKNEWIIPPKYLNVYPFRDGLAGVQKRISESKFKWGFINIEGDTIIPLQYDEVSSFNENGIAIACLSEKCGLINKENIKITEFIFDKKFPTFPSFKNGLILMHIKNKQFYINEKGEVVWKEN